MKFFNRLKVCIECKRCFEPEQRPFDSRCRPCAEPLIAKHMREEAIVGWTRTHLDIVGKLMDEDFEKNKKVMEEYYKKSQGQLNGMCQLEALRNAPNNPWPYGGIG